MTDKRCATCRHWDLPSQWNRLACWPAQNELRLARHCGVLQKQVGEPSSWHAGYPTELYTMPEFGCVLHEAREAAE